MHDEQSDQAHTANGEPIPDPGSGEVADADQPMTEPQRIHLEALCDEAGEPFDGSLSKSAAAKRIEDLENRLPGRGQD